jgi:hypothetical protein
MLCGAENGIFARSAFPVSEKSFALWELPVRIGVVAAAATRRF